MNLHRPSVLIATLDWHFVPHENRLTIGWDLYDATIEERLCIGAAPGRHLHDLEAETSRALARLCDATRIAAGGGTP